MATAGAVDFTAGTVALTIGVSCGAGVSGVVAFAGDSVFPGACDDFDGDFDTAVITGAADDFDNDFDAADVTDVSVGNFDAADVADVSAGDFDAADVAVDFGCKHGAAIDLRCS